LLFWLALVTPPPKAEAATDFDQSPRTDFRPLDLAALHLVVDHRATQARNLSGVVDRTRQPFAERDALGAAWLNLAIGSKLNVVSHD
jgi:hypothetical protein